MVLLSNLEVSDVISLKKELRKEELLAITASAESKSEHPLGKAIVAFAKTKMVSIPESAHFKMSSGKGVYAVVLYLVIKISSNP